MDSVDAGSDHLPGHIEDLVSRLVHNGATNEVSEQLAPVSAAWWSTRNAMTMCSLILLFGLLTIVFSSLLALKGLDRDTILKVVTIPMAVMSAIFLVVAGYSDSQIAPAMGLLGTVVGYVLGSSKKQATKVGSPPAS